MSLVYIVPPLSEVTEDDISASVESSYDDMRKSLDDNPLWEAVMKWQTEGDVPSKWSALTRYDAQTILSVLQGPHWEEPQPYP